MIYIIRVIVEIAADDEAEALDILRYALDGARMAEIVIVAADVTSAREED